VAGVVGVEDRLGHRDEALAVLPQLEQRHRIELGQ
jgi:hypothetical protein